MHYKLNTYINMLFNSIEFLFFLPIVFLLYWFAFNKSLRYQNLLILVASYFFYGWWSWKFMLLLALSTLLDYMYGFYVASPNKKKAKLFLWFSIINNLGILWAFKYYNFFITQFQKGFELLGLHTNPVLLNIALPVGISFYTFHGMSYVFDIYRDKQKPVSNFIEYAVFVSFFPLLVAGPIERANHLLPQVQAKRNFNYTQAVEGCRLILWGMFKKVVIADSLAKIVDEIFNNYQNHNSLTLILGAIAFSFQIYGDFSGYSDIAIGTAKLFGFELLSNFKFPYFSRDIAEFWRRWHISLSSWFRDYLYIPLGGSKQGKWKAVRNTFIIFLVSGFWHGASWNFLVWGGIHACGFLPLLLLNKNRKYVSDIIAQDKKYPSIVELWQMGTTFIFVSIAWIFFRADNLAHAFGYIKKIAINIFEDPSQILSRQTGMSAFFYIIPFIFLDWHFRKNERNLKINQDKILRTIFYMALIFAILFYSKRQASSFIYFQF
jgi:alginate O-acetyltransferase complex protein AlgI